MKEENTQSWGRLISRLQKRVNAEILAEASSVPLGLVLSGLAIALYMGRRLDVLLIWVMAGGLVAVVAALVWLFMKARHSFFSAKDARAYLDEQMGLYAALSASSEIDVPLPAVPVSPTACLKRKSWSSFYPVAGGVVLVIASWMLPLPERERAFEPLSSLPPSLKQVTDWVDMAEKTPEIDPESIEEFQEQMKDLLAMSREEMYTHSGLEAADAMKENIKNASEEMTQNLKSLSESMSELQSASSKEARSLSMQSLGKALADMEQSRMNLGGKLGNSLKNMNAHSMGQMTPDQLQKLRDQLNQAKSCANALCEKAFGEAVDNDVLPEYSKEPGEGKRPGKGGSGGGGDPVPISFEKDEYARIAGKDQQISPRDMERAALGDQMGVQMGEHDVDDTANTSPVSSKASSSAATGGNAVWVDDLPPAERDAIKKVFN